MDEQEIVGQARRIESLDDWLRSNGLGAPSELQAGQIEEAQRQHYRNDYAAKMHDKFFSSLDDEAKQKDLEKDRKIKSMEGITMTIAAADGTVQNVDVASLARSCDTVYAMASSWNVFSNKPRDEPDISLSLTDFPRSSINSFVSFNNNEVNLEELTPEDIVDCCQIAHYLQNESILESTVEVLAASIDNQNCLSICQLADQLQLQELFQKALSQMMKAMQDLEEQETNALHLLTPELRERIKAIRQAIETSVHSHKNELYFGSLDEYLAIFAERVQYYRERLDEAKEQYNTLLADCSVAHRDDTRAKIQKQEQRLRTLQTVFKEQKKLFGDKASFSKRHQDC